MGKSLASFTEASSLKPPQETDYLKLKQVQAEEVPLSVSTIYAMMGRGEFPQPVPVGKRGVAWTRGSIWAWKKQQEANGPAIREAAKAKRDAARAQRNSSTGQGA